MSTNKLYIKVILPLKLEWEPCYYIASDNINALETVTETDNITATDTVANSRAGASE